MERVAGSEKTIAPVPVTVLAGFLGAGKTTVLTSLLAARGDLRIAVVNVDARQLRQLDGSVPMAHFAELHSGCVCCSAGGDDLLGAIEWLVGSEGDADAHSDSPRPPAGANPDDPQGGGLHAIVVECSGVAEMFEAAREHSHPATAKAYLDAVVTVVDAGTVLEWLDSVGQAATAQQQQQPRPGQMAQLLVEQIECAHVIVLNKSDRVPHSKLATCCAAVAALNPTADLHTARFGVVPKEALATGSQMAGAGTTATSTLLTERGAVAQGGTALEGAVWSFVYRGRRPFHPERLNALVKRLRKALTQPPLPPPVTSAPARAVPTGHNAESAASSPSETSQSHIGSSPAEGAERVERAERVGSAGSAERAAGRAQGSLPQAEIASGSGGSACELGGAGARASRGEVGAAQAPGGVALHAEQEKGSTMMMLHGVLRAKGLVWVASCMDKSRPPAHGAGCPCCDPSLKEFDRLVFGGVF
eukprot:jgi/Mesen1/608/ME000108S10772